jgi:flagellum-specific peptidoglycan hydrolase FlgJ
MNKKLLLFIVLGCFGYAIHVGTYQNKLLNEVRTAAIKYKVLHVEIYLAQVVHETNWFSSSVFKKHKNLQGMMCNIYAGCNCESSNIRDVDGQYCNYKTIDQAVQNYAAWQQVRLYDYVGLYGDDFYPDIEEEYYYFLENLVLYDSPGHRYATDPHYIMKIKRRLIQVRSLRIFPTFL